MPSPPPSASEPLSPEDLGMWFSDQPRQRTTMAMLMLLDRRPDPQRLRAAVLRAVEAVPRMRQRVVDSPFDLSLPRWEDDPTFDLDFHVRRYGQAPSEPGEGELDALFRCAGPIYERPFDLTRPLWELIEIDRPDGGAAIFFRLHHAMADGVGGNAILAALTDATREGESLPPPERKAPGAWPERRIGERVVRALGHRVQEGGARMRTVGDALWRGVTDRNALARGLQIVSQLGEDARFESQSPLSDFGRSRHLSGLELDFEALRRAKRALGGQMIDLLLCGAAGAMQRWHRAHGHAHVEELATLVPINLRPPSERGLAAAVGNRATGILVRLPIGIDSPLERFHEIHRRVESRKEHPSTETLPVVAQLVSGLPRWLYRQLSLQLSSAIDLIVTNVPGIPVSRYLAGAEITAGYPFAPTAPRTPVSIALYGYRGRLFIGVDADGTAMEDLDAFRDMLAESFADVVAAASELSGARASPGAGRG